MGRLRSQLVHGTRGNVRDLGRGPESGEAAVPSLAVLAPVVVDLPSLAVGPGGGLCMPFELLAMKLKQPSSLE